MDRTPSFDLCVDLPPVEIVSVWKRLTPDGSDDVSANNSEVRLMKAKNNKLKRDNADLQRTVNELQQIISALNSKVNELEKLNIKQRADNDHEMDLKVAEIIVLST